MLKIEEKRRKDEMDRKWCWQEKSTRIEMKSRRGHDEEEEKKREQKMDTGRRRE